MDKGNLPSKSWRQFKLKKIKFSSETKSECERFNYTTTAETDESDKDGHWKRRRKSKHDEAYTYDATESEEDQDYQDYPEPPAKYDSQYMDIYPQGSPIHSRSPSPRISPPCKAGSPMSPANSDSPNSRSGSPMSAATLDDSPKSRSHQASPARSDSPKSRSGSPMSTATLDDSPKSRSHQASPARSDTSYTRRSSRQAGSPGSRADSDASILQSPHAAVSSSKASSKDNKRSAEANHKRKQVLDTPKRPVLKPTGVMTPRAFQTARAAITPRSSETTARPAITPRSSETTARPAITPRSMETMARAARAAITPRSSETTARSAETPRRITDSFPLSEARFQKRVISLLCEIRDAVSSRAGQERDIDVELVSSMESFDNLSDQLMADQELWSRMKLKLMRMGGTSASDMALRVVNKLITTELQCQFNMKGMRTDQSGKRPFKGTPIHKLIVASFMAAQKGNEKDLDSIIGNHLKHAPSRQRRSSTLEMD